MQVYVSGWICQKRNNCFILHYLQYLIADVTRLNSEKRILLICRKEFEEYVRSVFVKTFEALQDGCQSDRNFLLDRGKIYRTDKFWFQLSIRKYNFSVQMILFQCLFTQKTWRQKQLKFKKKNIKKSEKNIYYYNLAIEKQNKSLSVLSDSPAVFAKTVRSPGPTCGTTLLEIYTAKINLKYVK